MAWRYSKIENHWATKPPVSNLDVKTACLFSNLHRYADRANEGSLGKLGKLTPVQHLNTLLRARSGRRGKTDREFIRRGTEKLLHHRILEVEDGELYLTTFAPLHEQTRNVVGQRIREESETTPKRSPPPRTKPENIAKCFPESLDDLDAFTAYRESHGLPKGSPLREWQATDARKAWAQAQRDAVGF